jgi:hypothetical protein
MERTPHYSVLNEAPTALNPITGRSIYYGMRPYRCADRFNEWLSSLASGDNPLKQYRILKVFYKCARSEVGEEPKDPYFYLSRRESMYFLERKMSGMMRTKMFETYPYDNQEMKRIQEEDALKMRVWRHQRELELESKEGKVDEMILESVTYARKRPAGEADR